MYQFHEKEKLFKDSDGELYEILEKDDDIILKWYSSGNNTKDISENKVSKLLKNFMAGYIGKRARKKRRNLF